MPNFFQDKAVLFNASARLFFQGGGSGALNQLMFGGRQTHYFSLDGLDIPVSGGSSRTLVHSGDVYGGYDNVGTVTEPTTDLITTTLNQWQRADALSSLLQNKLQTYNLYVTVGDCTDPSDPNGWTKFVRVHSQCRTTSISTGAQVTFGDTNEAIQDSFDVELDDAYDIGSLGVSAWGGASVLRPIVDVTYAGNLVVGDCASNTDGSRWMYALQAGNGAAPPNVIYSTNRGETATALALAGAGLEEVAIGIKVFRNYLLVVTEAALYVATIAGNGVPSAFTQVTTGLSVPTNAPADMTVSGSGVVIVGAGGYIYFTSNPLQGVRVVNAGAATTADLYRVRAVSSRVLAGGDGGVLLSSTDGGQSWTTIQSASSDDVSAIGVRSNRAFLIGTTTGNVFATEDNALTWTQIMTLGGSVNDIVEPTRDTLFLSHTTASPTGRVYHSYDGGSTWGSTNVLNHVRLVGLPLNNGIRRMAYPKGSESGIVANNLLLGGVADDGTDGALYFARANVL